MPITAVEEDEKLKLKEAEIRKAELPVHSDLLQA